MRRLVLAVIGLVWAAIAAPVLAGPMLGIQVYEDNVLVGSTASGSGVASLVGGTSRFGYAAIANGVPVLAEPSLAAATISLSSLFGFTGQHTLTFAFTQTGLSSMSEPGGGLLTRLAASFTANFLSMSDLVKSVSLSSWLDEGNGAYAMTTALGATTFTSAGANASSTFLTDLDLAPGSLFSETILISAIFTGGGASVITSGQIVAVPEPASVLVFGAALLMLGGAMRASRGRRVAA